MEDEFVRSLRDRVNAGAFRGREVIPAQPPTPEIPGLVLKGNEVAITIRPPPIQMIFKQTLLGVPTEMLERMLGELSEELSKRGSNPRR